MATSNEIPVIDISHLLHKDSTEFSENSQVQATVKEILNAFSTWGFLYLKGHGIPQSLIEDSFTQSRDFFCKDISVKAAVERKGNDNFGYVPFQVETFDASRPFDLKECFNFMPEDKREEKMLESHPEFWNAQKKLYIAFRQLSLALFPLLDLALGLKGDSFLSNQHRYCNEFSKNTTTLRLLYYPAVSRDHVMSEEQLRCGEHSDYGTITFLVQDQIGGLQVCGL